MAKKKCEVCGTVLKNRQSTCSGCGMPQIDFKKMAKGEFKNLNEKTVTCALSQRTLYIIERLDLFAKLIKIIAFFGMIGIAIYSLFTLKWLLLIGCVAFYFILPFIALPITWMQMMLEYLYAINNKLK